MPRPVFAAALFVAASAVAAGSAQIRYRAGIDVVGFTVTVTDRNSTPVDGLTIEDFEVKEDGQLQNLTYFSTGIGDATVPLHIGLMFDTSESMEKDLSFSRGAAIKFLNTFPKAQDFTLVDFATEVRAGRFSQEEFPRLVERIRNRPAKGMTALYDALSVYLGAAFDQTGRKVLVIYTDGGDSSSSRTWNETSRLLRASDVTVYPIGFMANQGHGSSRLVQQGRLNEMAELTGGMALYPSAMKELDEMYARITKEINTQYTLGYVSTNAARDGKWRKVEVRVKKPSPGRLQVRTRQGYFAPAK
jgi:Ca-activated chloride channel family protein